MSIFGRTQTETNTPMMASVEYAAIADRMSLLRTDIAAVLREMESQGDRLQHLEVAIGHQPVALLSEIERQVDHLADVFGRAALKKGRDELLAEAGRHAWKIVLGGLTTYMALQWTHILGSLK